MAELIQACPDCGSIDIVIERRGPVGLVDKEGNTINQNSAGCPNCDWSGQESKTIGVASSKDFWTIERVGHVLLRVISKWGAGPMCQVFEFIGILEKDDQEARDTIMQAASAACVIAAFEAAHAIHLKKLKATPEGELNEAEKKILQAAQKRVN